RVDEDVDPPDEGDGYVAVGDAPVLAHQEAGAHAAGPADDAGHEGVVRRRADGEAAGLRGVDGDDHAGGWRAEVRQRRHVEVLGEVGAARDLELLGDHAGVPVVLGVELKHGDVVATELDGGRVAALIHVEDDVGVGVRRAVEELEVVVAADLIAEVGGDAAGGRVVGVEAVAGGGGRREVPAVVHPARGGSLTAGARAGGGGAAPPDAGVGAGRTGSPGEDPAAGRRGR